MTERRVWPWVTGAVAALAALAILLFLVLPQLTKDDAEDSGPSKSAEDTSGDLQVVPGMGGRKVAADGRTPVAYEPTCKGAVEAATNYSRLLNTHALDLPKGTDSSIRAVMLNDDQAEEKVSATSFESVRQSASAEELKQYTKLMRDTFHPEWSGKYLVRSCAPKKEAQISVTGVSEGNGGSGNKTYDYMTVTYRLKWSDGDWKIEDDQSKDENAGRPEEAFLAGSEGMPKPARGPVTVVHYDDGKFVADEKQQSRITMDSEAFGKAFEGVRPDISHWKQFKEAEQ